MHNKAIRIFNIGESSLDAGQVKRWLDYLGATDYEDHHQANDAEAIIGLAAKRCYMAFEPGMNPNVTKVRRDWTIYFDNILKSGHGSVLEHATRTYAIEGVTRVFTAEMNRHRAGCAISEGSMRFIRFDDIPFWMPLSIRGDDTEYGKEIMESVYAGRYKGDDHPPDDCSLEQKKHITREIFKIMFTEMQDYHTYLTRLWELDNPDKKFAEKKQITSCLRRIIGMGVCTGGVWTLNIRALRHVLAMRSTEHAEEEIALVASLIAKDIVDKEPNLMGDFEQDDQGFWRPKYPKV